MTTAEWIEVARIVAWPATVLVLAGLVFRGPLKAIMVRVQEARFPGGLALSMAQERLLERELYVDDESSDMEGEGVDSAQLYRMGWWVGFAFEGWVYADQVAEGYGELIARPLKEALRLGNRIGVDDGILERLGQLIGVAEGGGHLQMDFESKMSFGEEILRVDRLVAEWNGRELGGRV